MEKTTTSPAPTVVAPYRRTLHNILPREAFAMAEEEAPQVGRKTTRTNVGTATTERGTVFTIIYSVAIKLPCGRPTDLVGCGSGDYFSEALQAALDDFEAKRAEWASNGYL